MPWKSVSNKPGRTVTARLLLVPGEAVCYTTPYLMQQMYCSTNQTRRHGDFVTAFLGIMGIKVS